MKSITVKLEDGRKVEVKRLPLGRYSELLGALNELPKKVSSLQGKSNEEILAHIPTILKESTPDAINIIALATDIPAEILSTEYGLEDAIDLAFAVIEVNGYLSIYSKIKKKINPQSESK